MGIEFFTRLPLHGEAEYLAGDPRNRGDWSRVAGVENTGATSNYQLVMTLPISTILAKWLARLKSMVLQAR